MDPSDDDFLRELEAAFQVEADEHLQAMTLGLLALETTAAGAQPPSSLLETIYREAHSLKGAARAVNRAGVETICQSLETVFAAWKRGDIHPSQSLFDTLHRALDLVGDLLAAGEGSGPAEKQRISATTRGLSMALAAAHGSALGIAEPSQEDAETNLSGVQELPGARPKSVSAETVRISVVKLDALLLQAEEMLALKLTAGQRAAISGTYMWKLTGHWGAGKESSLLFLPQRCPHGRGNFWMKIVTRSNPWREN